VAPAVLVVNAIKDMLLAAMVGCAAQLLTLLVLAKFVLLQPFLYAAIILQL
jgi:hypothetical protein